MSAADNLGPSGGMRSAFLVCCYAANAIHWRQDFGDDREMSIVGFCNGRFPDMKRHPRFLFRRTVAREAMLCQQRLNIASEADLLSHPICGNSDPTV